MTPRRPQRRSLATLALDRDAEVPIGVQLAWALRARIGDGAARRPDSALPALRDMAQDASGST